MHRRPVPVLLAFVLLAAGCGDDGGPASSAATSAEDQRSADAALLVLADLPPGFTETPDDDEGDAESDAIEECATEEEHELDAGTTAEATGPDFERDDTFRFVGSGSVVLRTEGLAEDGIDELGSEELRACFDAAMAEGIREEAAADGVTPDFTNSVEDLTYFEVGDETTAFRMKLELRLEGQTVGFVFDFVAVRKGRTIGMYLFGGLGDGYPLEEQVTVVNKALARLG